MPDLIEVDGLEATLEAVTDVVEVVEIAPQGPPGPPGAEGPPGQAASTDNIPAPAAGDLPEGTAFSQLEELSTAKLGISAKLYDAQAASFTIQQAMLGKDIPITYATDANPGIILPALDANGNWLEGEVLCGGNGWQCKLVNTTDTAKTFTSGVLNAAGTKIPAYSSRVLEIIEGSWFCGSLTT